MRECCFASLCSYLPAVVSEPTKPTKKPFLRPSIKERGENLSFVHLHLSIYAFRRRMKGKNAYCEIIFGQQQQQQQLLLMLLLLTHENRHHLSPSLKGNVMIFHVVRLLLPLFKIRPNKATGLTLMKKTRFNRRNKSAYEICSNIYSTTPHTI